MHAKGDYDEREATADRAFDHYVSYEDGDGTVICDRRTPSAWIRSTTVWSCRR
ncbi:DUF7331 family protein [Haloterrigena salifodinae]|uniref:Uncharacterized protein n=1 Tax=Haloterrigena salifodinae TaxID=2675099 RepID=A0A8T8E3T6_9EURY|nr:hypothetical protein [Haloterrigena salifodinae]QRV16223.1 hypothetical protein JMJ58_04835 [Haloterrigena salifodinae]